MDHFKNPKAIMRPAPFWSWNDKLDKDECVRQVREMKDKGWGSFFMHSRVGLVTPYLGEEWMDIVKACAETAKEEGIFAWLYDEDKWPSGFAAGMVPAKNEDFRARKLIIAKKGEVPEGDDVMTEFDWNGASWTIARHIERLGNTWFNGYCYVDLMNPEAVKAFLECTHEEYKKHVGEYFGNTIPGVFTDEPCYLFGGGDAVPWSEYLPDFFTKMKGYDIREHLPQLFFNIDNYRKIRYDYYEAATALFKESFTKQYYDWCEANDMKFTGHFMAEDSCHYQTQWAGDVMSHYEFMHWPGTDKLGRHIEQVVTDKQCSSAVDQLGKERAFSEVFGCVGGQVSFFERKWIADWQTLLGISFVNHHLSLYSMRGERKRDFPANLFYQQPWWQEEKLCGDYFGRICTFAAEGKRKVDILLMQPMASVWSEFSPLDSRSGFGPENVYDVPFDQAAKQLMAAKLDYHIGNENLMKKHAKVEGDTLIVGQHAYHTVIVPVCSNIMESTYKLLRKFARNGGNLIFTGGLPVMVEGDPVVTKFAKYTIATSIGDAVKIADGLYPGRASVIDKLTGGNAGSVWVHEREHEGSLRYFFINTDKGHPVKARVSIPKAEAYAIVDLFDGTAYKAKPDESGDMAVLEFTFAPAGSILILAGSEAKGIRAKCPVILGCGISFADLDRKTPVSTVSDFRAKILGENTLVLHDYNLKIGDINYTGPCCLAWHNMFYRQPDGTPFEAKYTFTSEIALDAYAAIEVAENNDSILFNGKKVKPMRKKGEGGAFDPEKGWLEKTFTKVPISIRPGENTLVIKGKKYNNITGPGHHKKVEIPMKDYFPTEAEEAYICGDFSLVKKADNKYVIAAPCRIKGHNITLEGYPFYAGKVSVKGSFEGDCKAKTILKLIDANKSSVKVYINGAMAGENLWLPDAFDISPWVKDGKNTFEIVFATTLVNPFGPNRIAGIKDSVYISPGSFVHAGQYMEKYQLFDYGIGAVSIYEL